MVETMKIVRCKYCRKKMSASGIPAHISFKHPGMELAEFCANPLIILRCFVENRYIPPMRIALPAPNPLTIYSRRPLGFMAAPIPELRRPKGYVPPQNYARPADILLSQAAVFNWKGK